MVLGGKNVFIDGKFIPASLRIEDGRIASVSDSDGTNIMDGYILPGFIDIHTHGCVGGDFADGRRQDIYKMCRAYASHGVTSVVATIATSPRNDTETAFKTVGEAAADDDADCRILGINMEGPFIGADKKGAHDERLLSPPDVEWTEKLNALSGGRLRIVCVDPRLPGADEFITHFAKRGVTVSIAHTSADYGRAIAAIKCGASNVTHLFNAMSPMLHREPGVPGAFAATDITAELICDGVHIHPAMLKFVFSAFPGRVSIISDSIRPAGLPDGNYTSIGLPITVKDGKAILADGTIAGSTSDIHAGFKNVVELGVPIEIAAASATSIPARAAGVSHLAGSIKKGLSADFVVLNDALEIKAVFVRGKEIDIG